MKLKLLAIVTAFALVTPSLSFAQAGAAGAGGLATSTGTIAGITTSALVGITVGVATTVATVVSTANTPSTPISGPTGTR